MFEKLARFCLYTVPLVVVAVLPTTFFPFIGIKYFFFRILVTAAASFLLLGWAFEDEPVSLKERFMPILKSPVTIGFMLLTAAILLATAFAYDPHGAFWSNYERGEGSFMFLHYFLFYFLAASLFTEKKHWKTLMITSLVAAGGVAIYGIFSAISPEAFLGPYGGITGNFFSRLISQARFQGSLGNAAYVTAYFAFIAGYVGWMWAGAARTWKTALYGVVGLVLSAFFFVISGTRGTFVGLLAGLGVAAIYYAWREKKYRKWVIAVLVAGLIAFGGLLVFRNSPQVTKLPGARLLQLDFTQLTAQTRFWTWETAIKGWKDHPVLGYGPENFTVAFDKHFDRRHFNPGQEGETWFDRAHNIVLDYLASTGIVGVAAWLTFVIMIFVQIARAIHKRVLSPMQEAILLGIPVMYVVQSLLLFDVLPIIMNLIIFSALAVAATQWFPAHAHSTHARKH